MTGLLVLIGAVVASQRAAVDATYREMRKSSTEAVLVIQEAVDRAEQRPGAVIELIRILEGDQVVPLLGRIRRTAGSSEIAFAVFPGEGEPRFTSDLFDGVDFDTELLASGATQFTRSADRALVVVTPTHIRLRGIDTTVLIGISRDAPILGVADQMRGLLLIVAGIALLSAIVARLLSRQLASRLEPLATASRHLAGGDMSVRVPDLKDPELSAVASAFNEMVGELEASQIREREFILGVGHDLRTPLTTIGGYAEALESGEVDQEDLRRVGAVLGVQSRQLGRLIEDLSMLARLDQPEFSLRNEPVDIGAHVTEIVEGFSRRAKEVGVSLTVDASPDINVNLDPERLGQIAQNLVENALRFTPETGSVEVVVKARDEGVELSVSDSGIGIAPEDLPHVFDRHFVGNRRHLRNEGSGLGLSIVQGLVARMGGSVTAESTPGQGTTIRVHLPHG